MNNVHNVGEIVPPFGTLSKNSLFNTYSTINVFLPFLTIFFLFYEVNNTNEVLSKEYKCTLIRIYRKPYIIWGLVS